ncbi:hypothetical protein GZ977_002948 [Clostridium perfringens]
MKIRNKKEKEEYDMKKGIWVTISILSLGGSLCSNSAKKLCLDLICSSNALMEISVNLLFCISIKSKSFLFKSCDSFSASISSSLDNFS